MAGLQGSAEGGNTRHVIRVDGEKSVLTVKPDTGFRVVLLYCVIQQSPCFDV